MLLEVRNISKSFGGIRAVEDVSFNVGHSDIVGVIGPNGAGKSTLFNCILNVIPRDHGQVIFDAKNVTDLQTATLIKKGLARTFQIARVFPKLTTLDNMLVAIQEHQIETDIERYLNTQKVRRHEKEAKRKALEILDFLDIIHLKKEYASNLSGGQKKLLSLGLSLMSSPKLLFLDEPTAGINPSLKKKLWERVIKLRDDGLSFIVIEHDMRVITDICERIVVLAAGRKLAEGTPEEIKSDKAVLNAYLGD